MEDVPRISVCIPTHDRPDYLRAAIASVLASSERRFEIVVSDDACSTATKDAVASFRDARIRYLEHPVAEIASNWSNALKNARACYAFKLDDDDEISPDFLRECCDFLDEHPEVVIVFTGFTWQEPHCKPGQRIDTEYFKKEVVGGFEYGKDLLLNRAYPLNHKSAGVFRHDAAEMIGYFDAVRVDVLFTIAVAAVGAVGYIAKPLFRYNIHAGQREGMGERPMTMLFDGVRNLFTIPVIRSKPEWMQLKRGTEIGFVRGSAIRYVGDAFFRQGWRGGWKLARVACRAEPSLKRSGFFWMAVLFLAVIPQHLYLRILNFYITNSLAKQVVGRLLRL